jgi:hypothetical protein
MFEKLDKAVAGAKICSAMGAETIQKTRARAKSHKSSRKELFIFK